MTIQTAPLDGYHAVERWSEDTHYCPACNVLTVQLVAFRQGVCPHIVSVTDKQLMHAAATVAAAHGVHPCALDECCAAHWRHVGTHGACPHNQALIEAERGEVECGP